MLQVILYGDPDEFYESSAPSTSPVFQVEKLKQQHLQLQTSVSDLKAKVSPGQLSESLNELWGRVQAEASEYKITPDEALMRSIKRLSYILNDYLKKLRQQTNEASFYF